MKKNKINIKLSSSSVVIGCITALTLSGCFGASPKSKEYDSQVNHGDYALAASTAVSMKDKDADIDSSHLLPTLKAGNGFLYAKDYQKSLDMLDESERILKYHREQILAGSAADYMTQILLTDAAVDYKGTITDAVMLNTYKAIDYMIMGDSAKARVELNRAVDRQRRAKETYAELIGKQKAALSEKSDSKETASMTKSMEDPKVTSQLKQTYSNLDSFKAYPDFVNPFTTYLAGLFFAIEGDYSKSSGLLKEAYGMAPDNTVVESDFAMVENALSGKPIKESYVWVIYENGLGPVKTEVRLDIPVFLVSNEVAYAGIALPKIHNGIEATSDITIFNNGTKLSSTQTVADMDRVIMTEFKYTYNDVLTRAIISTVYKTYAQYAAKKYGGQYGGYASLAMGVFAAATTGADTRMWSSLPKDFQVSRVVMPADRMLQLHAGSQKINVKLGSNAKYSIVYVRIPTAMSAPSYSVANF